MHQFDQSEQILYALKAFYDKRLVDAQDKADVYVMLLFYITKSLIARGNYTEALDLCETGIKTCLLYCCFYYFPLLTLHKGCCLLEGHGQESGRLCIKEAYYCLTAMRSAKHAAMVEQYAKKMGIEL